MNTFDPTLVVQEHRPSAPPPVSSQGRSEQPAPTFDLNVPTESIIADGKHQVRDAESETDQRLLTESIAQFGRILVPLLLYALPNDRRRIIDGHRRLKAAKAVGLKAVPAYLFSEEVSELDCLSMALTTNAVRKNLSLLERYQGVWRHHTEGGLSIGESARRCGMAQSSGTKLLAAIHNNPKDVILAFTKQRASYRALYALTGCPTDNDKRALAKPYLEGKLTVEQLEAEVNARFRKRRSPGTLKFTLSSAPSYDAVLCELSRIRKRVIQLQKTNVDATLLPSLIKQAQNEAKP